MYLFHRMRSLLWVVAFVFNHDAICCKLALVFTTVAVAIDCPLLSETDGVYNR